MPLPMRAPFLLVSLLISISVAAQQPQRDPQAVLVLQRSLAAMGAQIPADSVATGTIVIVAGSTTEQGTIRILTRGLDQSAEYIQTPAWSRAVIYSLGLAKEAEGSSAKRLQLELAVTSQCPDFNLPLIAGLLNNPDAAIQYVGLETVDGAAAHHIRIRNTFSSQPKLQHLGEFSERHIWINAASGLPVKLSYERRGARGPGPRFQIEVSFSNYQIVGGIAYPFLIQKSLNGTPWVTITVGAVTFNTGLADADFLVR